MSNDDLAKKATVKKLVAWTIFTVVVAYYLIGAIKLLGEYRAYERDVAGWLATAKAAGNAEDMLEYARNLESGMNKHGLVEGDMFSFNTNPAYNLGLKHQALTQVISRLEQIQHLPQKEATYQVALLDLREVLTSMDLSSASILFSRNLALVLILCVIWLPATMLLLHAYP